VVHWSLSAKPDAVTDAHWWDEALPIGRAEAQWPRERNRRNKTGGPLDPQTVQHVHQLLQTAGVVMHALSPHTSAVVALDEIHDLKLVATAPVTPVAAATRNAIGAV